MTVTAGETAAPIEAPSSGLTNDQRRAAFADPGPRIPQRTIVIAVIVVLVLGLGGSLLEKVMSTSSPASGQVPAVAVVGGDLGASRTAFMALHTTKAVEAPGFKLHDQHGVAVSLAALKGSTVVLTFANATCTDICPVLANEIAATMTKVPSTTKVVFLTINTDTLNPQTGPGPGWKGLEHQANWHFLSGSINELNGVWTNYGISVQSYPTLKHSVHTDAMYFVSPDGIARLRATPTANESATKQWFVAPATEARWVSDLAATIEEVAHK